MGAIQSTVYMYINIRIGALLDSIQIAHPYTVRTVCMFERLITMTMSNVR